MEELKNILSSHSLRLTTARKAVFNALETSSEPLSVAQIYQQCPGIDRTSAYRVVQKFLDLNIITEVPRGWKVRYELAEPFKAHHHHLQCQKCGEIVALDTPALESLINNLATSHSYTLTNHHVELTGVCKKCQ